VARSILKLMPMGSRRTATERRYPFYGFNAK
jgi:hypothetical protein